MSEKVTKPADEAAENTAASTTSESAGDNTPALPSKEQEEQSAIQAVQPGVAVVIPFLKSKSQGDELKFALRSIAKNFAEVGQVIVIGDAMPWFSEKVRHIPHACVSDNPQVDVQNKIMELINDELVPDQFIMSNDDIYFVSPVTIADIMVLKKYGNIQSDESVYGQNKKRTIDLLKAKNLPTHNHDTHTPFFLDKESLVHVFETFPEAQEKGVLLYSLYYNLLYPNHIPISIDNKTDNWLLRLITPNPDKALFDKLIANKKFLNNAETGFGDVLNDYLNQQFPEKSVYEI